MTVGHLSRALCCKAPSTICLAYWFQTDVLTLQAMLPGHGIRALVRLQNTACLFMYHRESY